MRKLFTAFIFTLCSTLIFAGTPTLIPGIGVNSDPIRVGQEVIFSFNGTDNCSSDFVLGYDFGPNATPMNGTEGVGPSDSPMATFAVTFNAPGPVNVTLDLLVNGGCSVDQNAFPFTLPLEILPEAAIPTLSQWGLIILGMILGIFGIQSLRSETSRKRKSNA